MASSASAAAYRSGRRRRRPPRRRAGPRRSASGGGPGAPCPRSPATRRAARPARRARSAALNAAITPGRSARRLTSIRLIRACAIGLRRIAMCSRPGSWMLSVQRVRPVISRASSLRFSGRPMSAGSGVERLRCSSIARRSGRRRSARSRRHLRALRRRPGGPRGRCSGIRCSGRGCPPGRARISSSVGCGFSCSRSTAAMIMPGVQKPHCRRVVVVEGLLHGVQLAVPGQPLDRW